MTCAWGPWGVRPPCARWHPSRLPQQSQSWVLREAEADGPPGRRERSWCGEGMAQVRMVGRQQKLHPVQRKQQNAGGPSPAWGCAVHGASHAAGHSTGLRVQGSARIVTQ